jgi:hypothetical protein
MSNRLIESNRGYYRARLMAASTKMTHRRVRYAIVEVMQRDGGTEQFVLAYRTLRSLRDLIAAPRIVATGFASREAAMRMLRAQVASTAANRRSTRHHWVSTSSASV